MRSAARLTGSVVGIALVLLVGRARAEDAGDPDKLFGDAMVLIGEERYAEAIPKLEEAQRIDPGIGTQFNLAICYAKTGRLSLAWKNFAQVETLAAAAGKKERAEAARAKLEELQPRVPYLSVRVEDASAVTVSVDGVVVPASDIAFLPLDAGEHLVEVAARGKKPFEQTVVVGAEGERHEVVVPRLAPLERAPAFVPTSRAEPTAKLSVEIVAAAPLGVLVGGDVASACTGACSSTLPAGLRGVLHATYEAPSGFGGGLDVGYLVVWRTLENRPESLQPLGNLPANMGTVEDELRLSGLTAGVSAQYRRGEEWPVSLRIGTGVLLGDVRDDRSGTLTNSKGETYGVTPQRSAGATYVYFAPEARVGRKLGPHVEVNLGAEILLMAGLSQPKWNDDSRILTTNTPGAQGDGLGTFGKDSLLGSFLVLVAPGVGLRVEL